MNKEAVPTSFESMVDEELRRKGAPDCALNLFREIIQWYEDGGTELVSTKLGERLKAIEKVITEETKAIKKIGEPEKP